MLVAPLVLLPAVALSVWAWLTMSRIETDLRFSAGFESMDFEI